jgi:Phytanoyl-CoA dioxygenase (PhyH)
MWIPVDPVSFNSGTIRYVRGSHRWGFFKPNVSQMAFPGADGDTLPDIDGHEEEYDIVSSELEPGDLLVHHHLTVHGSAGMPPCGRLVALPPCAIAGTTSASSSGLMPRLKPISTISQGRRSLDCAQFPVWPWPARLPAAA